MRVSLIRKSTPSFIRVDRSFSLQLRGCTIVQIPFDDFVFLVFTVRFSENAFAEPHIQESNKSCRSFWALDPLCKEGALDAAFELLQQRVIPISRNNAYRLLQVCTGKEKLESGRRVQSLMVQRGHNSTAVLADHLVRLFACCGNLPEANEAFNNVVHPTVYSWSSIISAHASLGQGEIAMELLNKMQLSGVKFDKYVYLAIFKACHELSMIQNVRCIHGQGNQNGIQLDAVLCSALVDVYGKCGSLYESCKVFREMPDQNVVSWGAMIAAYAWHGKGTLALNCFYEMQQEGILPEASTYSIVLGACTKIGSLIHGRLIHAQNLKHGPRWSVTLENTLIDMYAKCGSLEESHKVFENLTNRDVVSWNALVTGYAQHGLCLLVLDCLEKMQNDCIRPNEVTLLSALKACTNIRSLSWGKLIHGWISWHGLVLDLAVGCALVDMYVKCSSLEDAQAIFAKFPNCSVVLWNTLLAGYAQHSEDGVLDCFEQMQDECIKPDKFTFSSILAACGGISFIEYGRLVHEKILRQGIEWESIVGSTLIEMYAKCGSLQESDKVFNQLPNQATISWNALIAGYVQHGENLTAIGFLERMQEKGIKPEQTTFFSILKACSNLECVEWGRVVHSQIVDYGLELDVNLGSALVDMYAKCGSLEESQKVFYKLAERTVVCWGAMIAAYSQHGANYLAFDCYQAMQEESLEPDKVTFLCILKACSNLEAIEHGRLIHSQVIQLGLDPDLMINNTLLDMYAKCGSLQESFEVFDALSICDLVSWNVLIAGCTQFGENHIALNCFEEMLLEGIRPNKVTFMSTLKACSGIESVLQGRLLHEQVLAHGMEEDLLVINTIVHMYAKCGSLKELHMVFHNLANRDVVSWNTIIAGHAQHGESLYVLHYFKKMQEEGLKPNQVTFSIILNACGSIGAIEVGRFVHDHILKYGLELDDVLGNTLIDMYAKCGCVEEAEEVFNLLSSRDIVSWNTLTAGYALHGKGALALECIRKMQKEGITPDKVTFLCILVACSHAGLLDKGHWYFQHMKDHHSIMPEGNHYTCIVDLLGRAGYLEEAEDLLQASDQPLVAGWKSLLNACKMHGDLQMGKRCFNKVVRLNPDCVPGYILMSNIYADVDAMEHSKQCWKAEIAAVDSNSERSHLGDDKIDTMIADFDIEVRTRSESHIMEGHIIFKC